MIVATQIRIGMTILYGGVPHKVLTKEHLTPGKGRGMIHAKLKNLTTSSTIENRFRSDEKIERAFLEQRDMEYLYDDNDSCFFMDKENYEQISIAKDDLGDNLYYLTPNVIFKIDFFEGKPIGIDPPQIVELKITETAPNMKGATATSSLKPAKLEGGLVVNVPDFIETGQIIRVDTSERKYLERVK